MHAFEQTEFAFPRCTTPPRDVEPFFWPRDVSKSSPTPAVHARRRCACGKMSVWDDAFERRYTRELCTRIEESLDAGATPPPCPADQGSSVDSAHGAGAAAPVLCTKLKSPSPGGRDRRRHTDDDRPAPGWVPRSLAPPDRPGPVKEQMEKRPESATNDPPRITESHMELLEMTAGESRRATVRRVLKSRQTLLDAEPKNRNDGHTPDVPAGIWDSRSMSTSVGPSRLHESPTARPASFSPSVLRRQSQCGVPKKASPSGEARPGA